MRNPAIYEGFYYPQVRMMFADIPKTASRAMLQFFGDHFGEGVKWSDPIPEDCQFSFSVVRNPYNRALSIWWSTCRQPGDRYRFKEWGEASPAALVRGFVEKRGRWIDMAYTQSEIVQHRASSVKHSVIHYENLEAELAQLLEAELGFTEPVELPIVNRKSNGRPVADYSREFISAVNEWCPDDFRLGDYPMLQITGADQPTAAAVEQAPAKPVDPVTIACVYKTGGDFTAEYVHRLAENVRAHATRPHRFVCLTDSDEKFTCETIPLTDDLPGWWSKLELFKTFWGRTVYFDLDTILTGSIDPLLDYDGPMALLKDLWKDNDKLSTGVMAWNAPMQFLTPTAEEKSRIMANPKAMDEFHVVDKLKSAKWHIDVVQDIVKVASYKWECSKSGVPAGTRIVCFHGRPRPHEIGWVL